MPLANRLCLRSLYVNLLTRSRNLKQRNQDEIGMDIRTRVALARPRAEGVSTVRLELLLW